jgi:hypothetical protein
MIPRVYAAINAVTAAFAQHGVAKERFNLADDYAYRSIDDVLIRLAPLLAEHKLCVLPRVLERQVTERTGLAGELLVSVALKVAYDLVSLEDSSSHRIEAYGEALDPSDKATAKAMQSAYKYAVIQAFAIPIIGSEDADASSPRLVQPKPAIEPVQGWERWCSDLENVLPGCASVAAVTSVQDTHRGLLPGLQRERPELYARLGRAIAARRVELTPVGDTAPQAAAVASDAALPKGAGMAARSRGGKGCGESKPLAAPGQAGGRARSRRAPTAGEGALTNA